MAVTADRFRAVLGSFASGVTVVTTVDGEGKPQGLTVSAFSSLSLDPPLVLCCIQRRTVTAAAMRASRRFAVSILSAAQAELSTRFASFKGDRFADLDYEIGPATGCPVLRAVLGSLECRVEVVHDGGDHDLFVGRVEAAGTDPESPPLLYFRGAYADLASRR
jgi:flavin reductase (DIM6/NTAB) family NADH-FMN oxidoreductase RutF